VQREKARSRRKDRETGWIRKREMRRRKNMRNTRRRGRKNGSRRKVRTDSRRKNNGGEGEGRIEGTEEG
jgi:hypothetical protein